MAGVSEPLAAFADAVRRRFPEGEVHVAESSFARDVSSSAN
jgi:hypothetical protein